MAPDGEEVNAGLELWTALHAIEHEPQRAWAGLLSALLRELRAAVLLGGLLHRRDFLRTSAAFLRH